MNWLGSANGPGPAPVIRIDPIHCYTNGQLPAGTRLKAVGQTDAGAKVYDVAGADEPYDAWFYGHNSEDPSRGYAVERTTTATLAEPFEQEKQ